MNAKLLPFPEVGETGPLQAFRLEVRRFLEDAAPRATMARTAQGLRLEPQAYRDWQAILHRRGWGAPLWPVEYGGPGWSAAQLYVFEEECARAHAPVQYHQGLNLIAPILMAHGSAAQCNRYLPRILSAEDWWCQGYSEPGAGSDLAALKTSAVWDGQAYIVSGSKIWTSYAHVASHMFCLVRTGRSDRKQAGLSLMLLEMNQPGVSVRPIITLDGQHHTNEVFLDGARVPQEALVGEEGAGWAYGKALLLRERALAMSNSLRLAEHLRWVKLRLCRQGLGEDGAGLRRRLCELEIQLSALRIQVIAALAAEAKGAPAGPAASMLKLRWSEILQSVTECGIELASDDDLNSFDAVGAMSMDSYLYNRATTIYGGSSEIQRNVIAKALLN